MTRRSFGIHTDVNGVDFGLLRQSALVKVLFQPNEIGVVKSWKDVANPNTYWLARTPLDQDNCEPEGELQQRYKSASTREQVEGVGRWYADWIASWALPGGLGYFFWEGGPNELDDFTDKAVWYSLAFTARCLEVGLKPAPGLYSFGKPGVIKYDGHSGWVMWQPVFDLIDRANSGKAQPIAGFQFHEYAMNRSMINSVDFAIERYKLTGYNGPAFIGEWGYAYGEKPPSTEEVIRQIVEMNARYGSDRRMCGAALYDIRRNAGIFNWNYMYRDLERALVAQSLPILPISHFAPGIIEVPPVPDPPQPGTEFPYSATVDPQLRLYVRTGPGKEFPAIALLDPNTRVTVLSANGQWRQIVNTGFTAQVSGIDGQTKSLSWPSPVWVHGDFLQGG